MSLNQLMQDLDTLIGLHKKNDDMWVDFFEGSREKILKDPIFGCEYLMMGWHGIGGYDETTTVDNDKDEALRMSLYPKIYELANKVVHDQN